MANQSFIYSFMKDGKARELRFESLRDAVDQACKHLEGEQAMAFQITNDGSVCFSGMQLIEMLPAWLEWRDSGVSHPVGD